MKKLTIILLLAVMITTAVVGGTVSAATLNITSKEAVLMSEQGEILFQHNATDKRPIASMTKIMTLLVIYDAIDAGKISLDDDVLVSANASSMGGSQVFLDANTTHKAGNLIKSIIICSANDSCVAMAEHISGSVEAFVKEMNNKASKLQLVATNFVNCTGLPEASQYSCAVDVANMTRQLANVEHYFSCANIWMEDYVHPDGRITGMTNTNKLVKFYQGCDGGKTGFTNEAMHCLSATAKRGETRLFAVVIGGSDSKTRFGEVSSLLNYGFANFECKVLLDSTTKLEDIAIRGGKTDVIEPMVSEKLMVFGRKGQVKGELVLQYNDNLSAPINCGDTIGVATIVDGDKILASCPIVARSEVLAKDYVDYIKDIVL